MGETDWGKLDLVLMGGTILHKYLIQFSIDGWGCVPSLLFVLRPNYGKVNEDNGKILQKNGAFTVVFSMPDPAAGHC